ncbi:unnamed protein product [Caretta caretta]
MVESSFLIISSFLTPLGKQDGLVLRHYCSRDLFGARSTKKWTGQLNSLAFAWMRPPWAPFSRSFQNSEGPCHVSHVQRQHTQRIPAISK